MQLRLSCKQISTAAKSAERVKYAHPKVFVVSWRDVLKLKTANLAALDLDMDLALGKSGRKNLLWNINLLQLQK